MAKGVFLHRADSIYDDQPEERYQFPKQYLKAARQTVGDWIVYLEPTKAGKSGYHAVAQVRDIISDPSDNGMYVALIAPNTYLPFERNVPFNRGGEYAEASVLNDANRVSGRAQAAMRVIPAADFNRIVDQGLLPDSEMLPREGQYGLAIDGERLREERTPFQFDEARSRVPFLTNRIVRDHVFRLKVMDAYDGTCAFTGLKLVNGGSRLEAQAAHIKPVEHSGPDVVANGLALSGTVHWMFDRGLLSLDDELNILMSRHINDIDGVRGILNANGQAARPRCLQARPYPRFLEWHRSVCFKA